VGYAHFARLRVCNGRENRPRHDEIEDDTICDADAQMKEYAETSILVGLSKGFKSLKEEHGEEHPKVGYPSYQKRKIHMILICIIMQIEWRSGLARGTGRSSHRVVPPRVRRILIPFFCYPARSTGKAMYCIVSINRI
jgi:hypothetical protein